MRQIVGYYVVPPGDLWVRFQDGEMRQATELEKNSLINFPELVGTMDWNDPICQQPQTGSVRRFQASHAQS